MLSAPALTWRMLSNDATRVAAFTPGVRLFDCALASPLTPNSVKLIVLLCHKCNLTSPQHGQRGSLLAIARAMSNRNVEVESGTCRCTRPAAAREVTFG